MSYPRTPRRILCGISTDPPDGHDRMRACEADRRAASQVLRLAARVDAEVLFLHVVDWLDERVANGDSEILAVVREAMRDALAELDRAAAEAGVRIRHELREGRPWRELLRAAREFGADVIAISPRRESLGLRDRIFHGSTATRILRSATCPVWIVEPRRDEVRRVLALVDLSPVSPRVVDEANALADIYGAERWALSCLDYPDDLALQRLPRARQEIEAYHREVRDRARQQLERLTAGQPGWQLIVGEDWIVRDAPRVIEMHEIDLVVLGSHSRERLAGLVLGTTAQHLLERVCVSTWVVRPEDDPPLDLEEGA
jgi:nucleotide-binding universal stress UspA family protein